MRIPLRERLSFRQARNAVLAALALGLTLSLAQIVWDLLTVRGEMADSVSQAVAALQDSAAQAAYEMDEALSQRVFKGLFQHKAIHRAVLVDDFGTVLQSQERPLYNGLLSGLARLLLGREASYSFPLAVEKLDNPVGKLDVWVDPRVVADGFVRRAAFALAGGVLPSLVLALLLTTVYYHSLTSPLVDMAGRLASVDPGRPDREPLPMPPGHEKDELGLLCKTANTLLAGFAASLEERRQAEENLRLAEEAYRGIFDNAVEGLFQSSVGGRFLRVNPAMVGILGYASAEDLMQCVTDIGRQCYADPEDRTRILRELSTRGRVEGFETRLLRKDGSAIWASINARALLGPDNAMCGVEGIVEDVSLRKEAEEELAGFSRRLEQLVEERTRDLADKARELEEANRKLRELDELKSAFLSTVSHELRTPLTSILGFAKLIHRDFANAFQPFSSGQEKLEAKGRRIRGNLEIIENEGARLSRMINDFLDLAKIESGRLEWADCEVSPADVLRRAVEGVGGMFADGSGVRLLTDIPEDLPALWADPDRLEQVFLNLLTNATKFTEQGSVTLSARRTPAGAVQVRVQDTGVGIPEKDLPLIFDKFHQVRRGDTLKDSPRGTGLGLAICRQIVAHYQGRISAASEPGKGSVFTVELPVQAPPAATPDLQPAPPAGEGPLVLVVDDHPHICSFLSQVLSQAGCRVLTAQDGPSALEAARRHRPDLITMDIIMPGMSGRQVIARLRQDPDLAGVPILVITILSDYRDSEADAALTKPIDEERLLDTVHGLLGWAETRRPILALRRNGEEELRPYFAQEDEKVIHCAEPELWTRIGEGFEGTVVLPAWAAKSVDISRLTSYRGVQVLILPEPEARIGQAP